MALVSEIQGIIHTVIAVLVWEVHSGFYLQLWSWLSAAVGAEG